MPAPEYHDLPFDGHLIRAVLDDATAFDILAGAGATPPEIPPGCNTVSLHFTDAAGRACLYVGQRGFARTREDNEQPVNGAVVFILQTLPAPSGAPDLLGRFLDHFLKT